jgi:hypothetical protein
MIAPTLSNFGIKMLPMPLTAALRFGQMPCMSLLLDNGADPRLCELHTLLSPLELAHKYAASALPGTAESQNFNEAIAILEKALLDIPENVSPLSSPPSSG